MRGLVSMARWQTERGITLVQVADFCKHKSMLHLFDTGSARLCVVHMKCVVMMLMMSSSVQSLLPCSAQYDESKYM